MKQKEAAEQIEKDKEDASKRVAETTEGKKKFIYGARAILNFEKEKEETFESKRDRTDSLLKSITSDSDSMSSVTESSIKVDDDEDEEMNF